MITPELTLSLSCADRRSIVSEVTRFLLSHHCNILDSQQYTDQADNRLFMRVHFLLEGSTPVNQLEEAFAPVTEQFGISAQFSDTSKKTRVLIMASRLGPALVDLLHRMRIGAIPMEVPLLISNNADCAAFAAAQRIPLIRLPVTNDNLGKHENRLSQLVDKYNIDLIVLARYVQALSSDFCRSRLGKIINIHHGFLQRATGGNTYNQAYERGVKLIGATAHYVTGDFDMEPIIEESVERVTHAMGPEDYVAAEREIESRTLARAVKWHCEHRVLLNGRKTVVFS